MPALIILLTAMLLSASALAQPGRTVLSGHVPPVVSGLASVGQLPAETNLSLAIGLPLRNQADLDEFLRQLQDPASTNYHQYLQPQEFAERYGPTEDDYQAVMNFAQSNGLKVVGTHGNRVVLDVAGAVADIERAFQIKLRLYQHPTESRHFFAPDTEPSVPANLRVNDMWGLNDFSRPKPLSHQVDPAKISPLNYNGTGEAGSYLGRDFRNAYAPGTVLTGAGQTAAVVEFDGYYASDITKYEAYAGYANVPLTNVLVNVSGNPGYSGISGAVGEVSLDIEVIIAMAPGLSKVMVYEGNNPYDVYNKVVTDNKAKQISSSWSFGYGPTHKWHTGAGTYTLDSQLQQMQAQGQSFFQASGDSDAYTGSQALSTSTGPIPVDSIYVTSVGGTSLNMNGAGVSYNSESVWNWGNNTGTGGGVSPNYSLPSWQTNANLSGNGGSTSHRNIPDVALTADAVFVVYSSGSSNVFGGTSCAAPLWAGFTALMNQQSAASGHAPAGFLNPTIYSIGAGSNYAACFHDTTSGNNIGANTAGLYNATNGYDLCTGWGTPNGTNLINAFAPYACILTQPTNRTVTNGNTANFSVAVGGQPPISYAWLYMGSNLTSGGNISGTSGNVLTIGSVAASNAGNYSVIVTNSYGAATSSVAVLTWVFPPSFAAQPTNQSVLTNGTAVFAATVGGATPLTYQWRLNGTNLANGGKISGATSNVLTITSVATSNAGNYTLVASNVYGTTTSSAAALTLLFPAAITTPPAAQTVQCGSNAAFTVTASGTAPLSYQWSVDGVAVSGATGTSFTLTSVHLPNHSVAVLVTNLYGAATNAATLTVQDTLPPAIAVHGANPYFAELGSAFVDPGASAADLCAGAVSVSSSGAVNTGAVGTNTLTYRADDGNGNSNSATRTVIVRDTTPPVISWSFTNLTLAAGSNCAVAMPDVTGTNYILASDLSGSISLSQIPTNSAALPLGTNVVVITVADPSGNKAYATNQIVVEDQTPPLITGQPQSQTNFVQTTASFGVAATACTPLAFQWLFSSTALPAGTNATLILSNLSTADAGGYSVIVSAVGGSSTSAVAFLTVNLLDSAVVLTATNNPSGYLESVNFTATVMPTNATGTIQFLTNGVAFDSALPMTGPEASTNLASLPRGTNMITAIYSGDANFLSSTNELSQIVTNHPPTATGASFARGPGGTLEIAITDLAALWNDVDGDTVSLVSISVSTNGVTLTNDSGTITYSNANNVADQFVCTLSDGWGGTNFQTVNITIQPPSISAVTANPNGSVMLTFTGPSGVSYVLDSTTNFPVADWQPLATNIFGTNGIWQFTDGQAADFQQRFFRLRLGP